MASPTIWRPLPLLASNEVLPLLVSFSKGSSEYTIQVTDLANVWVESLDRKSICIRAWNQDTSIDPSDTAENMSTFLKSLHSAVDSSVPGHEGTSVQLARASSNEAGGKRLTLTVECKLPGFPDLKWPFHLKQEEPDAIARLLVIPLIQAQQARQHEAASLIQLLNQKDSVISKLADKLEATGTGLDQVFTALAARKSISRQAAEDKIKGLGPFKESKWKTDLNNELQEQQSLSDVTNSVFGGHTLLFTDSMTCDTTQSLSSWWQNFEPATSLAVRKKPDNSKPVTGTPSPAPQISKAGDSDDEFQVQSTPPHLKSRTDINVSSPPPKLESPPPVLNSPPVVEKKPVNRLCAIGGAKRAADPIPLPQSSNEMSTTLGAEEDTASETASEADETASLPDEPAQSRLLPSPKPIPRKSGGLGRIGGVSKPKETEVVAPSVDVASSTAPAPRRIGTIGGVVTNTADGDTQLRGRPAVSRTDHNDEAIANAETPRETSQERADKKREQLKRDLEKQAAAGPSKKKRRF
ncbi:hypothetical protein VHEMI05091 [[Torrubiella] hemipterigena]|uniref:Non-homologous end-joining factor 1 n=1 Tax=[Torrubiella] hemipterigena TaxID=1531966 RepID=A0A0A1SX37_9HYPO|nr:hypothetical protein VHEMI05091 [[Torrubiella] hemipterigena]